VRSNHDRGNSGRNSAKILAESTTYYRRPKGIDRLIGRLTKKQDSGVYGKLEERRKQTDRQVEIYQERQTD
jgi:hypothetical protein